MIPQVSRLLLFFISIIVAALVMSLISKTSLLHEQTPLQIDIKGENRMSRKTYRPTSWLTILENARIIFIGEAIVTEDVKIPATETSFRGAGYRITAQISPQELIVGSLPREKIYLQGQTSRTPDTRLNINSAFFPPDTLHRIDYWDYAQINETQRVLVILSEPNRIKVLSDSSDTLPEAVNLSHSWLQLPRENQKTIVLEALSQSTQNPVAYLVGFELLSNQESDLSVLFENFNNLPGRPGAAIQGIVDHLYNLAISLSESEIKILSRKLLDGWQKENDPAVLSSYLIWFDAYRKRTWQDDQNMRQIILAEAKRAQKMSFSGVNAEQWQQQISYYASVLINNANN